MANRGFRKHLMGAAALSLGIMAAAGWSPPASAAAPQLTGEETAQVSTLAAKVLAVVTGMPSSSSSGAFEGNIAVAVIGYTPEVISKALTQAAATPGLPTAAVTALSHLALVYSNAPRSGNGKGPGSTLGTLPDETSLGFAGGGGGGTSSSYTK